MHMRSIDEVAAEHGVIIGPSPRMWAVFEFLRVIANSESTVVITGESGTGKEVIASLIHRQSPRKHRPFVAVSCALFSDTLIESELFGHERGAFTGAIRDRPGRFELAESGTVLLDDIDDVPLSMQVKLLRVLQNHTVERLGGTKTVSVNVRIIAGTKRDLRTMVADGTFREDLYYRLNVLPLTLPPLRERMEDLPVLTEHFLSRFFTQRGEAAPAVSPGVARAFASYDWPGNVRELENMCERMAQTNMCGTIGAGCLAAGMVFQRSAPRPERPPADSEPGSAVPISLDARVRQLEHTLITWAMRASDGNQTRAAELLQIKRSTLQGRMVRCQPAVDLPATAEAAPGPLISTR
ncbi:MAG: sigma 54-interacting transcriptional regulator [Vicinamibacterales bacterium]